MGGIRVQERMLIHWSFSPSLQNHENTSIFRAGCKKSCAISSSSSISSSSGRFPFLCTFSRNPTKRRCREAKIPFKVLGNGNRVFSLVLVKHEETKCKLPLSEEPKSFSRNLLFTSTVLSTSLPWLATCQAAKAIGVISDSMYDVGELFELGIQLSYLLLLLALLGVGTFFVIRQVLVRRELDLSAKELQEQVRSGDASATELFELGAVMLRRKFYPAATKYLLEAIEKWDGEDQYLAQVYNALGVTYVRDGKVAKGIAQFENAVKLQPGYVTAWNNLADAYEKTNDLKSALSAFEEVLLFDPNNKIARPRRDALKEKVDMYKGVAVQSKKK